MYPQLNPNSGVPLFRQIVKELKGAYLKGLLKPGYQLPSVRQMSRRLGINPATVVKAYDQLEHERLIMRHQGRGAFVTGNTPAMRASERRQRLAELATEFAIEGLRLNATEEQLIEILERELENLRPREAK